MVYNLGHITSWHYHNIHNLIVYNPVHTTLQCATQPMPPHCTNTIHTTSQCATKPDMPKAIQIIVHQATSWIYLPLPDAQYNPTCTTPQCTESLHQLTVHKSTDITNVSCIAVHSQPPATFRPHYSTPVQHNHTFKSVIASKDHITYSPKQEFQLLALVHSTTLHHNAVLIHSLPQPVLLTSPTHFHLPPVTTTHKLQASMGYVSQRSPYTFGIPNRSSFHVETMKIINTNWLLCWDNPNATPMIFLHLSSPPKWAPIFLQHLLQHPRKPLGSHQHQKHKPSISETAFWNMASLATE